MRNERENIFQYRAGLVRKKNKRKRKEKLMNFMCTILVIMNKYVYSNSLFETLIII